MRIGITDFAQEQLGDVVYVDLPAVGQKVLVGVAALTIESINAVSDISSPFSGEVTEVNDDLQHNPEWINQDPYGKGWIALIELDEDSELKSLLSAAQYKKLLDK